MKKPQEALAKVSGDKQAFTPHEDEDVETLGGGIVLSVPSKVGAAGSRMTPLNPLGSSSGIFNVGGLTSIPERDPSLDLPGPQNSNPNNIQPGPLASET
jgi:hypothetical protein